MVYEKPGKENTQATVELVLAEAKKRGIKHIVVASYNGYTADFFVSAAQELNVVIVRGAYGFGAPDKNSIRMPEDKYKSYIAAGMTVVTAAHALSGAERSISGKFSGAYPVEIIAHTLRMLGQGVKVCVECSTMACDCGAVPAGEPVIAVAGTGSGADTAVILRPSNTQTLLDTKICEILCKPYEC